MLFYVLNFLDALICSFCLCIGVLYVPYSIVNVIRYGIAKIKCIKSHKNI